MTATTPTAQLVEDLVDANHILFHQGIVDAFGHVSVRHGQRSDRFLLARNVAPGSVVAAIRRGSTSNATFTARSTRHGRT